MAIFLTEYLDHKGRRWAGPDINAKTRREAEKTIAWLKQTIVVLGPLVEAIDAETGDRTAFPPPG